MTGIRIEDLPPAMRAQALAQLGRQPRRRTTKRQAPGQSKGVCSCGTEFPSEKAWERHSDGNPIGSGHARFQLLLE